MEPASQHAARGSFWTDAGVDSYIEALKSLNKHTITEDATKERIKRDIANFPTIRQFEATEAFLEALKAATAGLDRTRAGLSKTTHTNKSAGKVPSRSLFSTAHIDQENHRKRDFEENLRRIENYWGSHIAHRYRFMPTVPQTACGYIAAMSSRVDNSIAVAYMNAEILKRMERASRSPSRAIHSGHSVSAVDARRAMEKLMGQLEIQSNPIDALLLPALNDNLLEKHGLRISKTTGLLKPKVEEASDDEIE
ncbi:hypothetical protein BKA81DRAFT_379161 [Phyllosticta paracitricarpa]|uniref:Uncharacterized protein n=1 Tax=Phyllosticta paracitricarpa TaxID=2016321 RepID=A0ABR1MW47_9PEZI